MLAMIKAGYDLDWSGAEKDFQQAIALNPNYAETHQWYSITLTRTGRLDDGMAEIQRALELDPLSRDEFESGAISLLRAAV